MKLILAALLLIFACGKDIAGVKPHHLSRRPVDSIPKDARILIICYKDFVAGFADNHLVFKDGSKLIWDDGIKNKPWLLLLAKPDLKDMFLQKYPAAETSKPSAKNFDPGRVRDEQFFLKIYGRTKNQVKNSLTDIVWCPKLVNQKISVTKVNGVDRQLLKVSVELDEHPELQKYLANIGGTFAWRSINGTNRHSMHSFGMTIDINTRYSDYWQWACKCSKEEAVVGYKNRIPPLIVAIFEKYGFIWGGNWYHFDTMHFEYRPELLYKN